MIIPTVQFSPPETVHKLPLGKHSNTYTFPTYQHNYTSFLEEGILAYVRCTSLYSSIKTKATYLSPVYTHTEISLRKLQYHFFLY